MTKITIKLERDALRAQLDTERERHKGQANPFGAVRAKDHADRAATEGAHDTPEGKQAAEPVIRYDRKTAPDETGGDVVPARSGRQDKRQLSKRYWQTVAWMLDCSDQPWRVDEVVKLYAEGDDVSLTPEQIALLDTLT